MWTAVGVSNAASGALITSNTACDLYHLWSGLTDWYELKPDDRAAAVAAMRRAATEWPAVKDERTARDAYDPGDDGGALGRAAWPQTLSEGGKGAPRRRRGDGADAPAAG